MDEQPGLYLTIDQVAERLHVGVRQVYNHINDNRLRTRKQGRSRLVLAEDVDSLAQELGVQFREDQRIAKSGAGTELAVATTKLVEAYQDIADLREELGRTKEQRDSRLPPDEIEKLRERATAAETRAQMLEQQVDRLQSQQPKSLWQRFRGK